MNIFQKEIILNTNDVDFQAKLSIPAIMRHFQVIAADHTNILGVDHYSMIEKSNAFWVITKLKFEAIFLPNWNEKVIIKTWPLLPSAVKCNRDFEFLSKDGDILVRGISEWCILDLEARSLRRVSTTIYPLDMVHLERRAYDSNYYRFSKDLGKEEPLYQRTIRLSDLDLNIHTNNTIYSNMVMDAFSTSELKERMPFTYEIHFNNESKEDDILDIYRKDLSDRTLITGINQKTHKLIFQAGIIYQETR